MLIVRIQTVRPDVLPAKILAVDVCGLSNDLLVRADDLFVGTDVNGTDWIVTGFYYSEHGRLFAREFVEL